MLLSQINLDDPNVDAAFKFKQADHEATWAHYYKAYYTSFAAVIKKGLTKNYAFNPCGRALLFLLRHTLELLLKYNLDKKSTGIPITHALVDIAGTFTPPDIVPADLLIAIGPFVNDGDGSCWRYWGDADGNPYFIRETQIKFAAILRDLNAITGTNVFEFHPASAAFNYDSNRIQWDMTLHIGMSESDWHVKCEYDCLIDELVECLASGNLSIEDAYLPLLFCIRHAIELALKGNIAAIQPVSDDISQKNMRMEHSLATLYNVFTKYLDKVDWSKVSLETQAQYRAYRNKCDQLNGALHMLDHHSRAFRYPMEKDGTTKPMNLVRTKIKDILKLYQLTDAFLTFTTNVLIDNNLLEYDPDVHG